MTDFRVTAKNGRHYGVQATTMDDVWRVQAAINQAIDAGDPDLARTRMPGRAFVVANVGAPGRAATDRRRFSRQQEPIRPWAGSKPLSPPGRAARRSASMADPFPFVRPALGASPPPSPRGIGFGTLSREGAKRGVVDDAILAGDLIKQLGSQVFNIPATLIPSPAPYIEKVANDWGFTNPNIKARNFSEHLALDGTRFAVGSLLPIGGPGGWARAGARGLEAAAPELSTAARAVLHATRHPARTAAAVGSSAFGGVAGGELADRYGVPREYGATLGSVIGGAAVGIPEMYRAGLAPASWRGTSPLVETPAPDGKYYSIAFEHQLDPRDDRVPWRGVASPAWLRRSPAGPD